MSKLNINKNEWLELVFEGRNKEYGAYQLRQEEGKTTVKAFFSAMALLTGLALIPVILSSFTDKPVEVKPTVIDKGIKVTQIHLLEKEEQKKIEKQIKKADVIAPKTENLVKPKIVEVKTAPETTLTENKDLVKNTSENPLATNGNVLGSTEGTTIEPVKETPKTGNGETIVNTSMVEKNPAFPGGIEAFLRIVGNKFVAPEMEEEKTLKVIVFFVVEKDGSLSNISVPRSPGFGLDKEAIRVLKSIKTKWEPGIYKGEPVRTQYSLPIVVKTN
ncbi:MAG: energy transducer TonB [Bacteroidota bacterium]